ncbi:MAG: DUF445 domain-containing protein [Pseudomonadota bacterium]
MKRVATLLLLAMTLLFVATYQIAPASWVGYVRAFAEAAMVGALADWFAVTALFRHPLGLPIPHTAIIPENKDRLGDALARFVRQNFLTPEVLAPRLEGIAFGRRLGSWLQRDDNAARIARDAGALVTWILRAVDDDAIRGFLSRNLHLGFGQIKASQLVSRVLALITADGRHQRLVDEVVKILREQLYENRRRLRERITNRTPWWMPDFVDDEIYDKIMTELESVLDQIGDDPDHPARIKFNDATDELIRNMASDPAMIARGEQIKREILEHPSVTEYLGGSWTQLRDWLGGEMSAPDSATQQKLTRALKRLGAALDDDDAMREQVDGWLRGVLLYFVANYREAISQVISDTVRAWDGEATARRIERQVGRDLQFIRINGTLVGGCAGLLIYTLVHALTG